MSVPTGAQPASDPPPSGSHQQPVVSVTAADNPPSTSSQPQVDVASDVSTEDIPVNTAAVPVPDVGDASSDVSPPPISGASVVGEHK